MSDPTPEPPKKALLNKQVHAQNQSNASKPLPESSAASLPLVTKKARLIQKSAVHMNGPGAPAALGPAKKQLLMKAAKATASTGSNPASPAKNIGGTTPSRQNQDGKAKAQNGPHPTPPKKNKTNFLAQLQQRLGLTPDGSSKGSKTSARGRTASTSSSTSSRSQSQPGTPTLKAKQHKKAAAGKSASAGGRIASSSSLSHKSAKHSTKTAASSLNRSEPSAKRPKKEKESSPNKPTASTAEQSAFAKASSSPSPPKKRPNEEGASPPAKKAKGDGPNKKQQKSITSFLKSGVESEDKFKNLDFKPLPADKRKFVSKAEKQHLKEQERKKKQEEKEERRKRKLEEKAAKQAAKQAAKKEAQKKPHQAVVDDSTLDHSKPLNFDKFKAIHWPISSSFACDALMIVEFFRAFSDGLASQDYHKLTFEGFLELLVTDKLNHVLALLLLTVLELDTGKHSCKVPSPAGAWLGDLPVNEHTSSEVLAFVLKHFEIADDTTLQKLASGQPFHSLDTEPKVKILAWLCSMQFESSHVVAVLEDSYHELSSQRKARQQLRSKRAKQKKGKDSPQQPKDGSGDSKPDTQSSGPMSRAESKALAETVKTQQRAAEIEEQELREASETILRLEESFANCCVGYDRDWRRYYSFTCIDGLFVVDRSTEEWKVVDNTEDINEFVEQLDARGHRERSLKARLKARGPWLGTLSRPKIPEEFFAKDSVSKSSFIGKALQQGDVDSWLAERRDEFAQDVIDFHNRIVPSGFGCVSQTEAIEALKEAPSDLTQSLKVLEKLFLDIEDKFLGPPLGVDENDDEVDAEAAQARVDDYLAYMRQPDAAVSKAQLCLYLFETSVRWESSCADIKCRVCRKKNNPTEMIICDSCNRGYHLYCLKPRLTSVPEGDWLCNACLPEDVRPFAGRATRSSRRVVSYAESEEDDSDEDDEEDDSQEESGDEEDESDGEEDSDESDGSHVASSRRRAAAGRASSGRQRSGNHRPSSRHVQAAFASSSRSNRVASDLRTCEDLLKDLRRNENAWPFLAPTTDKEAPNYSKVIAQPMDFQTILQKLDTLQYPDAASFASDMRLVFRNCHEYYRADTDEVEAAKALEEEFEREWKRLFKP